MKISVFLTLCFTCMALFGADAVKELKILAIGNSFSASMFKTFPAVVQSDPSCKLLLEGATIGGCSLKRHWEEHQKSEKDPSYKPYGKKYTLRALLKKEKWDIVTIQQASRESWLPQTYQPYAEQLISLIRQEAPQAEIVIQQTWSYNAAASAYPKWKIDQTTMYEKLTANYRALAEKYGFRQIPSGYAVQLYRKALGDKLLKVDVKALKTMKKPEVPANNDVVGRGYWGKNKKTKKEGLIADWNHLNPDGKYLQALVWYGMLYGKDPQTVKYVPEEMPKEQAELLKKCAAEAVSTFPQVKK